MGWITDFFDGIRKALGGVAARQIRLHYFEDIWPVELAAINARRAGNGRPPVRPLGKGEGGAARDRRDDPPPPGRDAPRQPRSPDPAIVFGASTHPGGPELTAEDPGAPDENKMRPKPVPCDAIGLALSGGGVRSAAVGLGALQSVASRKLLPKIDYLSTVSGGGYIGASLSAGMSEAGTKGVPPGTDPFPFGADIFDNPTVARLRNFSNYLMPRDRSGLRNLSEGVVLLLRGLVANLLIVTFFLLFFALITRAAFRDYVAGDQAALLSGSMTARLTHWLWEPLARALNLCASTTPGAPATMNLCARATTGTPAAMIVLSLAALAAVLLLWAIVRSARRLGTRGNDTSGPVLAVARMLLILTAVIAFIDIQPVLIQRFIAATGTPGSTSLLSKASAVASAFSGVIALLSGTIGQFLQKSERSARRTTMLMRMLAKAGLLAAAALVPLLVWLAYVALSAALFTHPAAPESLAWIPANVMPWLTGLSGIQIVWLFVALVAVWAAVLYLHPNAIWSFIWVPLAIALCVAFLHPKAWHESCQLYFIVGMMFLIVTRPLSPNGYSLHRFYRDRLSWAFLFGQQKAQPALDRFKLSELKGGKAPYHIINAALNLQGSTAANQRGRDADFFTFTQDFVGSDLTMYTAASSPAAPPGTVKTKSMENIDPALDLATAMAISGAAVSANMGSATIRALSPTLALLNIRLGYWMSNPRAWAMANSPVNWIKQQIKRRLYLLIEMLNLHDEKSPMIYLSDGGHIENLGLYELLKRGCRTIVVIDAEADPEMAFPALLKAERYARIDLGIRIELPWEGIALAAREAQFDALSRESKRGPHCALGRIRYADGKTGHLLYVKSSLTGDEKDYILDYRRRNTDFPHETTADQFFSEEQFEMYRALGFHMIDGALGGGDDVAQLDGQPNRPLTPAHLAMLFDNGPVPPVVVRLPLRQRRTVSG